MVSFNYKFRLYSTKEQKLVLEQTLDVCRRVYDHFLSFRSPVSEYDMKYALVELKEQYPWLRNYHSGILQMVCKQVVGARRAAKGKNEQKPSYLKSDDFDSFTYDHSGFILDDNRLWLSRIRASSLLDVKQVTVFRKYSKWYAVAVCAVLRRTSSSIIRYKNRRSAGVAIGTTEFCRPPGGHSQGNNRVIPTKILNPLRRAPRRLSRKEVVGGNYRQAKHMLARLYARIYNKRKDFLHKKSTHCTCHYCPVIFPSLQTTNLIKARTADHKLMYTGSSAFRSALCCKVSRVAEAAAIHIPLGSSKCGHRAGGNWLAALLQVLVFYRRSALINRGCNASLNVRRRGPDSHTVLPVLSVQRLPIMPVQIAVQRSRKQVEVSFFKHG